MVIISAIGHFQLKQLHIYLYCVNKFTVGPLKIHYTLY
jgi:hypothetical protein